MNLYLAYHPVEDKAKKLSAEATVGFKKASAATRVQAGLIELYFLR